jgi:SPP1 family predicted phage head-tail adaptor
MNTQVVINTYSVSKDAGGGVTKTISSSYTTWAKVEDRTGSTAINAGQRQINYDYRIEVRYYSSRPITSAQTVNYQGKVLSINGIKRLNEGRLTNQILYCSIHGGT